MRKHRVVLLALLIMVLTLGCALGRTRGRSPDAVVKEAVSPMPTYTPNQESSTPLPTATVVPVTETLPTLTPAPSVRVIAANGNLYIRCGPGTPYSRIGVLYKGTSAEVIGQDMLSKWVQIRIPESEATGWISLLTPYSQIEGNLSQVTAFTFTEWPEPAYIKNCTEHNIIIMPNELYLNSLWTNAQYLNQSQIDPGFYEVRDADMVGEPLIEKVDIQEGETYYITMNGLGEYRKCPENN